MVCTWEELNNYDCLRKEENPEKIGFSGQRMQISTGKMCDWRKIYLRGLQMRRNILEGNFEGWRLFANLNVPIVKMSPIQDLLKLKKLMGDVHKLSANDDLKIDWDEKHLVGFTRLFQTQSKEKKISKKLWNLETEKKIFDQFSNQEFRLKQMLLG